MHKHGMTRILQYRQFDFASKLYTRDRMHANLPQPICLRQIAAHITGVVVPIEAICVTAIDTVTARRAEFTQN